MSKTEVLIKMNELCKSGWDKESLLNIASYFKLSKKDIIVLGSKRLIRTILCET